MPQNINPLGPGYSPNSNTDIMNIPSVPDDIMAPPEEALVKKEELKKEKKQSEQANEIVAQIQDASGATYTAQYGRFKSVIDLEKAKVDDSGNWSGASYNIFVSSEFGGNEKEPKKYYMAPTTLDLLLKEGEKRDQVVRKSGDITYHEAKDFKGNYIHGPTTDVVRDLENTVYNQAIQGVYDAAPMVVGRAAFLGTPFAPPRIRFAIGLAGFAYGLTQMEVLTPDMAEKIYENQMGEIEIKEKEGFYIDKYPPRVLTVDQIRDRLDPKYASLYTKSINAISRGFPASAMMIVGGGGVYPIDKAINMMTGGRFGKSANAMKKAELYFKAQNDALIKSGGTALPTPTSAELVYRASIILKQELKKETENMKIAPLRFIYGFNTNQKIDQMKNPLNYILKWGVGEIGAGGGQGFAAYSDFPLTGGLETQTIDKIPYALAGAMLLPKLAGIGINFTRNVAGLLAYVATTPAVAFQSRGVTNALINPAINARVYDFISGKNAVLPEGIDGATTNELFAMREQMVKFDAETGGQMIDNLRVSMQTVEEINAIVLASGKPELIDKWDPRAAFGVLTQLDVIKAIENQYIINKLRGQMPTMGKINPEYSQIQDARAVVIENGQTLMKLLLDADLTAFSNKSSMYNKFVTDLNMRIAKTTADGEQLQKLGDTAIAYKFSTLVADLMVTAEKEGLSPVTLEKAKLLTEILDNNPGFAENFEIVDEVTKKVLKGKEAVQAYKESIQLSISEIYENSQRANVQLDELYNNAGKGDGEKIQKFRIEKADHGTVQASTYYAHTNMQRVKSVQKQNRTNYTLVGKDKQDGLVDITDMWTVVQDKLKLATNTTPGLNSATAAEDVGTISTTIDKYFNSSVRFSVDEYLNDIGPGNAENGYKVFKALLKKQDKLAAKSMPNFSNKVDLARWFIENGDNLKVPFKITATLGELKGILSKTKDKAFNTYGVSERYKPNGRNKLRQSEKGRTWSEISEITKGEYLDKLSRADVEKLKVADGHFRDVVIPMRDSGIYAKSHGTIKNPNVKSSTGFNHGSKAGDDPQIWLEEVFETLQNSDKAKSYWKSFIDFYGPAEIVDPSTGKLVRNHEHHNALTSISDYLQFRVHKASEGILWKSGKGKSAPKTIGLDPDLTNPNLKDQVAVTGTAPLTDEGFLTPLNIKGIAAAGEETYSSPFEHNKAFTAIQNLEKASGGAFIQGLAYNSLENMHRIVAEGGAGSKIIKDTVKNAVKNIEAAKDIAVRSTAILKANGDVIQNVLKITYQDRGNTAKIADALLKNPDTYDILLKQLDMGGSNSMKAKGLIQYIVTDGLIQLSKSTLQKTMTGYGVSEVIAKSEGMILKSFFDDHANILKKIFDTEHFETFQKINNYLLRFVTDAQGDISSYKFTRPDGLNIQYSNTKIMNRIWTTQIGKTNPSWLGIEALASVIFNTNSNAFAGLMMNSYVAKEMYKFLVEGKLPANVINPSELSVMDHWVALTNGLFGMIPLGFVMETSEDETNRQGFNRHFRIQPNDPNQMEKWQRYKDNVGGNAIIQSKDYMLDNATKAYDYIGDQMDALF